MRFKKTEWMKAYESLEKRCALYGITVRQYDAMKAMQEGRCKICNADPYTLKGKKRILCIDHSHMGSDKGRVRGLICFNCNKLLLPARMTAKMHEKAAIYMNATFDARTL